MGEVWEVMFEVAGLEFGVKVVDQGGFIVWGLGLLMV